jgi:hypothetical protein
MAEGRGAMMRERSTSDNGESRSSKKERDNSIENDNADEENQDETPQPVGFWHPALKHVRHEAMLKWLLTSLLSRASLS